MSNKIKSLKPSERKKFWYGHIRQWENGELNQTEYCRINSLDRGRFYTWKKRFDKENMAEPTSLIELPIQLTEVNNFQPGEDFLEIFISEKIKVRFTENTNPDLLRKLFTVLEYRL